jgi:hypothetical protein
MMDFVVRETRAVVDGPMAIIRLGTCGLLDALCPPRCESCESGRLGLGQGAEATWGLGGWGGCGGNVVVCGFNAIAAVRALMGGLSQERGRRRSTS